MADFFVWTEAEFGVKVAAMDEEHRVLIDKMNAVHKAYQEKAPFDSTLKLVQSFAEYTVKHFSDEEAFMEKIKFEGLPTHKIIHQQLLSQFQTYLEEFKTKKVLTESFFNFLKVWLTGHIRGIDTKYGAASAKKPA